VIRTDSNIMGKGGDGPQRLQEGPNKEATNLDQNGNVKAQLDLKQVSLMEAEPGFYWQQDEDPHSLR
jgi:hypothetical protein